jgi:DNA polymerase-3 subunit alpha
MCKVADMGSLNRKTLESLVRVGAFDEFGDRGAILNVVDRIIALAQSETRLRDSNQTSMFEVLGDSMPSELATITLPDIHTSEMDRGAWEADLLGVALSNTNALNNILSNAGRDTIVFHSDLEPNMSGQKVKLAGQISSVSQRYTRDQRPFTIASLSLIDGAVEVMVWEDAQKETQGLWEEGKLLTVTGMVRVRDDQINISCTAASEFIAQQEGSPELTENNEAPATGGGNSPVTNGAAAVVANGNGNHNGNGGNGSAYHPPAPDVHSSFRRLNLRIRETDNPNDDQIVLDDIKRLLLEFQGNDEVYLEIATEGRVVVLEWPQVRVKACPELEQQLASALVDNGGHVRLESVGA